MAGSVIPGPLGTHTKWPEIDPSTMPRTNAQAPGPNGLSVPTARTLRNDWSWGAWKAVRWKLLPAWIGGRPDSLRRYKDAWVAAHKDAIIDISATCNLPPLLLAGVSWIEVGGDPDWFDSVAYVIRRLDHAADPGLESQTITKTPALTSFGDVSIQLRRVAETIGLDVGTMTEQQKQELLTCLSGEVCNLGIVAMHLKDLKELDFGDTPLLGDDEIRIIATRYNRGPDQSLSMIRIDTSYGDFIIQNKQHFFGLLGRK